MRNKRKSGVVIGPQDAVISEFTLGSDESFSFISQMDIGRSYLFLPSGESRFTVYSRPQQSATLFDPIPMSSIRDVATNPTIHTVPLHAPGTGTSISSGSSSGGGNIGIGNTNNNNNHYLSNVLIEPVRRRKFRRLMI
jgi:hypothetical protein